MPLTLFICQVRTALDARGLMTREEVPVPYKLKFDMRCPFCKKKFEQKIEDMRPGKSRSCPYCSAKIEFTGDDGRKAQKAIDDLKRSFDRLSKKWQR